MPAAQIYKRVVNDFSGGPSEDRRIKSANRFGITKHFDIYTKPHELVPYAKTEASNGLSGSPVTDLKLTRFRYAPTSGGLFRLFGLGANGSGFLKVYKFDIDGSANLDTENWVAATNGTSASGARSESVFFYYKGFIYMYQGTTSIARFDVTEVAAFADSWQTIDDSTIGVPPLLHPSDDVAYFFGKQVVYSLNNTTWNGAVLTLPTDQQIVARCAYGDYIAIACVTLGNFEKRSIIYLWDRDSSLTTLTERIDCGEGEIKHLANLNNKLSIVMSFYLTNAYGLSKSKVVIKTPSGKFAVTLNEITTDTVLTASDMPATDLVRQDKLYFPMKATLNSDTRLGIWAVDENGKYSIDYVEPNAASFRGIYATANLWWIAYDDGSGGAGGYSVSRTDDDGAYSATTPAVYESLIDNGEDVGDGNDKKLLGIYVTTKALPSGGQVTLKYRKNGATSWTTIFSNSTANSMFHDAVNIESDHSALPQYKEIEFRIESLGGAVVTGYGYAFEVIKTLKFL
jgi:hypothetical protein